VGSGEEEEQGGVVSVRFIGKDRRGTGVHVVVGRPVFQGFRSTFAVTVEEV
jgi:hypothetical protein